MALTTRVILGIATIAALLVIAALPPRPCDDPDEASTAHAAVCGRAFRRPTVTHERVLQGTRNRLRQRLTERLLTDSLGALARTAGVRNADGSIVVLYESPVSADSARTWLALAQAERDRIPGAGTRARVVVALETSPVHAVADKFAGLRLGRALRFIGATDGATSCFVLLRITHNINEWSLRQLIAGPPGQRYGAFLGSCGLVARFGPPNAAAGQAMRFGFADAYSTYSVSSTAVLPEQDVLKRVGITGSAGDVWSFACLRGSTAACAERYGLTRRVADDFTFSRRTRGLLLLLLAQQGPEAFERFWRAPGTFEQALSSAYGKPAGEVMREVLTRQYYIKDADKSNRPVGWATMGWLTIAVAAAFVVGARRQAAL